MAVLAHFFIPGDTLTHRKVLGVLIAYGGILVLFGHGLGLEGDLLLGESLSATSGFPLGAHQVYNARIVQDIHPAKLLLAQALFGIVAFVAASAIVEPDEYLWTGRLAVSILYQGAIIAGFGFIGNLWLVQHYLPSQVSVIALSQPVLSIAAAWMILGEPLKFGSLVERLAGGHRSRSGSGSACPSANTAGVRRAEQEERELPPNIACPAAGG